MHTRESILQNDSLVQLFQGEALKELVEKKGVPEQKLRQLVDSQSPELIEYMTDYVSKAAALFAAEMNKTELEVNSKEGVINNVKI